uniref:Uncharacterized protein AlNc14C284G10149 n=1 Tax=Albugo laibachii Nc14 TaxID=890382 RepID=F0WV04_9STRA|nr:conserved hypothetical protein [Albugo laibachii Nc14]|eukprot:CCA25240.1 conserved hypothetical protein [Albugo laibachii Nc14]
MTSRTICDRPRVIVHLDLDCFYAQVEGLRLNIPESEPIAAHQWGFVLAVNYVARQYGVKRGDQIDEALKKCPKIHIPHVEVLGENRLRNGEPYDRAHQKATLRRYRDASNAIFKVLRRHAVICERAGIDEAYLDVTERATELLANMEVQMHDFCMNALNRDTLVYGVCERKRSGIIERKCKTDTSEDECDENETIVTSESFPLTEEEQLLCVGALISREIREAVYTELGYRCSTGISTNKLIAKLASPLNKPNGQTIVSPRFVPLLMRHHPIQKVRGLGGKLGHRMMEYYDQFVCSKEKQENKEPQKYQNTMESGGKRDEIKSKITAGDFIQACSLSSLSAYFGNETAAFVYRLCLGDDGNEPVDGDKVDLKGFSSTKQFTPNSHIQNEPQLRYWLRIISEEMMDRINEEKHDHRRFPVHVTLHITSSNGTTKCRRIYVNQSVTLDTLARLSFRSLENELDQILPLSHMTLHAKDFISIADKKASISSFFSKQQVAINGMAESDERLNVSEECVIESDQVKSMPKAKQKNIKSFFTLPISTSDAQNQFVDNTFGTMEKQIGFYCVECKRDIQTTKEEHKDYHFAKSIREQDVSRSDISTKNSLSGAMDAFLSQSKKPRR